MSAGLTTIENALAAWIRGATGLAATNVLWGDQDIENPITGSWVSCKFISTARVGQDWHDIELNPTPTPGAEIVYKTRGQRRAQLSIQCFGGSATGLASPRALLDECVLMLASPAQIAAFAAAGLGIGEVSDVQDIGGVKQFTIFEPRALLTVTVFYATERSETGTYIETVDIDGVVA